MFITLLKTSLNRIDSLQFFYTSEVNSIKKKSEKGKSQYEIGALLDTYFQMLTTDDEKLHQSKQYLTLESHVLKYIEVVEIKASEDTVRVIYRTKDSEKKAKSLTELNVKKAAQEYIKYAEMPMIHGSNTLIMLITRFEEFIANFSSEIFTQFPQRYLDKQAITFSELTGIGGIEEIKGFLFQRQIEALMRESYSEWFKLFESHGISLDPLKEEMSILKEMYARRNILVHNSGAVNSIYLKNVPEAKYPLGTILIPDREYIEIAFETIKKIIIVLLIEAAKLVNDDKQAYLKSIFTSLFDLLQQKEYSICKKAYDLIARSKIADSETRIMSQFDSWICIIQTAGLNSVKSEIEKFDVSALDDIYVLAKHILLEQFEEASLMLSFLLEKELLPASIIEEWPLFINYRNSDSYQSLRANHATEFGLESAEIDNSSIQTQSEETKLIPLCSVE